MELELKITCTCHQAKIVICCQQFNGEHVFYSYYGMCCLIVTVPGYYSDMRRSRVHTNIPRWYQGVVDR